MINPDTTTQGDCLPELRFPLSANDPNQDDGDWQYNVSIDAGSGFVDLGASTQYTFSSSFEDGFHTFIVTGLGGSSCNGEISWKITAWDGSNATDSCTVEIDHDEQDSYDACGNLDTVFEESFCLPTSGPSGLNYNQGVGVTNGNLRFASFTTFDSGALNLGGDTAAIQFTYSLDASAEAISSHMTFYVSEVQSAVSATQDPARNGAALGSGFGFEFVEQGDDWRLAVFRQNPSGGKQVFHVETLSDGINANIKSSGLIRIDPWAQMMRITLGNELINLPIWTLTSPPTDFAQWWVYQSDNPLAETFVARDSPQICFSTTSSDQFGGQNEIGTISIDGAESFEGEGGFGGEPQYPGMNITEQADALEIEPRHLGWLLAGMLFMLLGLGGFFLAGSVGSFVGVMLAILASVFLNLIPLWLVVILFLLAAGAIVLFRSPA